MRYADDTQLWGEILHKERAVSESMRDMLQGYEKVTGTRFGNNNSNVEKRGKLAVSNAMNDNLKASQSDGFYKMGYLLDNINHHSDPPYCQIKPGYRPSIPFPNNNQLEIKKLHSFHQFGMPKNPRGGKDIFRTTFRNTMQEDTPYYRNKLEPFNVKHALVDPSHTFNYPLNHKSRKDVDLLGYDLKYGADKTVRQLQHERRETIDYNSSNIVRLPERRDYIGEEQDPVAEYYKKRNENRKFFRLRSEEKVDLNQFGKTNYMVSPSPVVGITKQKNYYTDKKLIDILND